MEKGVKMLEWIKKHGLLDADFVQPMVFFTILLVMGSL
tara:strand:+ start:208 stop:321 length:114 start_codon:yes stop_codon:yes gene_type:complete